MPAYLIIFSVIKTYSCLLRHYQGIFRHIQHLVQPLHIHLAIFWALAYLEQNAYLKPCETLTRYIQNPVLGHYSAIFRHIQNLVQRLHMQKPDILEILEYSETFHNCILTHIQNHVIFTKIYEYSELCHL